MRTVPYHAIEGFALDWHGCLIDGQHRAAALIETDMTVTAQVTYNLAPDTFAAIDGGRVRTAGDFVAQITEMKQSNSNVYGAALKILGQPRGGPPLDAVDQRAGSLPNSCRSWVAKWPVDRGAHLPPR